jgi:hypothetical protein
MKYLKLFENFEEVQEDLKDILQYLEDDLDLYVTDRELGRDLEIAIYEKPPSRNSIGRFRFDKNVKNILDLLINYCKEDNLKFSIKLWSNGRQVINVDGRDNQMTFDYRRPDYSYVTKEIKSLTEIPTERWVNTIQIVILHD